MHPIRQPIGLKFSSLAVLSALALASQSACSESPGPGGSGGTASGGASSGGTVGSGGVVGSGGIVGSGGAGSGGGSTGGASSTGGSGSGGLAQSGGASSGGGNGVGGASGGSDGSGGAVGFQPCPATGACKIVPFGDSITEGMVRVGGSYEFNGGYRVRLFELAVGDGKDITFVGNSPNAPNGPDNVAGEPFPKAHEGMSGWTVQQLIDKETIWDISEAADDPHIVLLHIGTNDINTNQQNGAPARLETLIDRVTTELPDALLVVAKIIPLPSRTSDIDTYNAAMDAIVAEKVDAGKHVLLLDLNSDYPDGQLPDNIHPSADGYAWMGEQWYETIAPYLP